MSEGKATLRLDEANELFFKIKVYGAERPPKSIRLVCEVDDVSYSFKGEATPERDVVRFVVPALKQVVQAGQLYETRVEVIVDDRYFVPVRFQSEFSEPVNVVGEAVRSRGAEPKEEVVVRAKNVLKSSYPSLRDAYARRAR